MRPTKRLHLKLAIIHELCPLSTVQSKVHIFYRNLFKSVANVTSEKPMPDRDQFCQQDLDDTLELG
jgi:hypothetical protein